MGAITSIEWCDHTFNPWIGCRKVSEGCDNCYIAHTTPFRVRGFKHGSDRGRTGVDNWKDPLRWNLAGKICPDCQKPWDVDMCARCLGEPRRRRVFCASLADWLDNEIPIEWLADLLQLIHDTPNLDWLLVTKRPQNWRDRIIDVLALDRWGYGDDVTACGYWLDDWQCGNEEPDNIWFGVTAENQKRLSQRFMELNKIPARIRFLSCEPMLSEISLRSVPHGANGTVDVLTGIWTSHSGEISSQLKAVDWVICGGESGTKDEAVRMMEPEWARTLRHQCAAVGVPFLFKQWGDWLPGEEHFTGPDWKFQDGSIVDSHLFPDFNENPVGWAFDADSSLVWKRVGKKRAGRLLDGRQHNEFPVTTP